MQPLLLTMEKYEETKTRTKKVKVEEPIVMPVFERPACLVTEPEAIPGIIDQFRGLKHAAFDCETTGLDFMRDVIHGISIANETTEYYICDSALLPFMTAFSKLLKEYPETIWWGHNVKFDMHFTGRYDCLPKTVADTMVAQWLVDENFELGLKSLAVTRLGCESQITFGDLQKKYVKILHKKKMEEITVFDIPLEELAVYGAGDSRKTYDLAMKLLYDLDAEKMADIFWNQEMPFLWVLYEIEENGMYIDQSKVVELDAELTLTADACLKKWNELSNNVNPNSPLQLGKFLFEVLKLPLQGKTDKGAPSTDALTLQRLAPLDTTGAVAALQDYRKVGKLLSTYIGPLRDSPYQGRLHGSFNQTGAVTGRLSASDPNLQNIPARGEMGSRIREAFAAEKGNVIIDCDYSQIELRMIAHYSKEPNFIKTFTENGDPHQTTADLAHVERYVGKTINFGWCYGCGPNKLCDIIEKNGKPRPEQKDAKVWLKNFDLAYPTLVAWKNNVIKYAHKLKYVTTIMGRKRRLPDLDLWDEKLMKAAERQTVNAIIQGSSADMIKWAMIQLRPYCKWFGARMICQVHDELLFECPEDVAEEFAKIVESTMTSIKEKFSIIVPILAEPGIAGDWSSAKQ